MNITLLKYHNITENRFKYYFIDENDFEPKKYLFIDSDHPFGSEEIRYRHEKILFNKEFDFAKPFLNNYAFVKNNGKWQIINELGIDLIEQIGDNYHRKDNEDGDYKWNQYISDILQTITPKSKWGGCNIHTRYYCSGGYFLFSFDIEKASEILTRWGGELVQSKNYETLRNSFGEEGYLFFDFQLNPSSILYEGANIFSEGFAPVKEFGKKWGYIDTNSLNSFSISNDDEYTTAYVIEPKFEEAFPFYNGLAKVKYGGKYGYITPRGDFFIEPKFQDAKAFKGGLAEVLIGKSWKFIDYKENVISVSRSKGNVIEDIQKEIFVYNENFHKGTQYLEAGEMIIIESPCRIDIDVTEEEIKEMYKQYMDGINAGEGINIREEDNFYRDYLREGFLEGDSENYWNLPDAD